MTNTSARINEIVWTYMMVKYKSCRIKSLQDNILQTKTYEDWSKYLGLKPHRLGVVARMYTDNTLNFITDGLRNIFYKDEKADQFQLSSSLLFEWINNMVHYKLL